MGGMIHGTENVNSKDQLTLFLLCINTLFFINCVKNYTNIKHINTKSITKHNFVVHIQILLF